MSYTITGTRAGVGMGTGTYASCGEIVRTKTEGLGYQQQLVR
jgi:hypothetical protein